MVKKRIEKDKVYYLCEECNFAYADKATAMRCEDWCTKYHSCNIEITKEAIQI